MKEYIITTAIGYIVTRLYINNKNDIQINKEVFSIIVSLIVVTPMFLVQWIINIIIMIIKSI